MEKLRKNRFIVLIVTYFGGWFGAHKFLQGNIKMGLIYMFTFGLFGFGWFYDIFKAIVGLCPKSNKTHLKYDSLKKSNVNPHKTSQHQNKPLPQVVPKNAYSTAYMDRKANNIPSSYIVFDTETTGLEPSIDKIIEISAIKYVNHQRVNEFSMLVNPKRKIDPFITKLTGIKNSDLSNKKSIDYVLPLFYEYIEDYTLIAHNAPYDIKMLACESYRCKIPLCKNKVIDTVTLAKRLFNKNQISNYKLTTIKDYFGLAYGSHRALDDCETCSALYQYYCEHMEKQKQ